MPDTRDSPALAAGSLAVGAPKPVVLECRIRNPAACRTTAELVWAPGFERAIQSFGGKARTEVFGAGEAPLSEVLLRTLRGPPDDPIRLADGTYLFTACAAHYCTEKGAIVLTASGSITMAATLTNHLVNEVDLNKTWGPHYSRLDIFLARPTPAAPAWRKPIRTWAKAAYASNRDHYSAVFETHSSGLTEYRWLVSPESRNPSHLGQCRIE